MKSLRNHMFVMAGVALAAICKSAAPAVAQATQGSFTLPHEVHWQAWTFPAGHYAFRMDAVARTVHITSNGANGPAFVSAMAAEQTVRGEQSSSLIIERRGNSSIVSELYLTQIGATSC